MKVSFYKKATGEFTGSRIDCPLEFVGMNCPPDCEGIEGVFNPSMFYVLNYEATPRPECTAKLDGMHIIDVPFPGTVEINGVSYEITDSTIELDFPYPGAYRLKISSWPYLDKEFEVTV